MAHRSATAPRTGGRPWGLLAVAWLLFWLLPVPATASESLGGVQLDASVRRQLWRLQQSWQSWTHAWSAADADAADAEIEQMRSITEHLGMARLPDLSAAAAAYAVRAAQEGDFERARWSLEASAQLDPDRPETHFARSAVARLDGDYVAAVTSVLQGVVRVFQMPLERSLWLHDLGLWLLYSLLVAGCLFVALLMVTKGGSLFYDVARLMSPPLQRLAADGLTVVLLVWPLLLPSGFLWLALYWSVLLWGYASKSERGVLVALWLMLGAAPVVLALQQRSAQMALVPPARLIDNLGADRLYGSLFSDLGVLRTMVPDSLVVTEMVADLHRRLGQWEEARAIYTELAQDPEQDRRQTATAYTNIGVYHHRRGEYESAIDYFRRAAEADPALPEAFFNLAQAYSQLFDFDQQHQAMARAKELDAEKVERWNVAGVSAEESVVPVDGGLRRAPELRAELEELWRGRERRSVVSGLWYRYRSFGVALAALLLALVLHQLRRQVGYRSRRAAPAALDLADNRWLRALVPGLASAGEERGVLAYLGLLLPVALVLVSLMGRIGYRVPLAVDPGHWLVLGFTLVALALLFVVRLGLAWSAR